VTPLLALVARQAVLTAVTVSLILITVVSTALGARLVALRSPETILTFFAGSILLTNAIALLWAIQTRGHFVATLNLDLARIRAAGALVGHAVRKVTFSNGSFGTRLVAIGSTAPCLDALLAFARSLIALVIHTAGSALLLALVPPPLMRNTWLLVRVRATFVAKSIRLVATWYVALFAVARARLLATQAPSVLCALVRARASGQVRDFRTAPLMRNEIVLHGAN